MVVLPYPASLSEVSITHNQPWSENVKGKTPEINYSEVLNYMPF
jgi:hypothetical protein